MNGTTKLRPAGSVSLYLPKRSTTPAYAWGTTRIALATTTTTNSSSRPSRIRIANVTPSRGGIEDGPDVCGRADDLDDLYGAAGLDAGLGAGRDGEPALTADLDPPRVVGGNGLGDEPARADQAGRAEDELRPAVQPLHQGRADGHQQQDGRDGRD